MKKFSVKLISFFIPNKALRKSFRKKYSEPTTFKTDDDLKKHIETTFYKRLGYSLNIENPTTFNEKIQYLKFKNKNNALMTLCADKHAVRKHIESKGLSNLLVKSFGAWESADDINWEELPNQFVLKTNHDSGGVWIVKDKNTFDKEAFKKKATKLLKRTFGQEKAEFCYRDIPTKIIAEEFLQNNDGGDLKDYKVFCFHGEPHYIQIDFDRFTNHTRSFYNTKWENMQFTCLYPLSDVEVEKPSCLEQMLECAKTLSKDFTHCRVDFYVVQDQLKFGEITFFHESGMKPFIPEQWDKTLGDLIKL